MKLKVNYLSPPETLPDLVGEVANKVMANLIERGYNPLVHDIDTRIVTDDSGHTTIQTLLVPRKTGI